MPYLIDGHNLIPKIPGLNLQALDDEEQLIALLQEFCRRQRKQAEVFFDKAPPGGVRVRSYGLVTARFVGQGLTADQAIRNRLTRLGRSARNWTVVSSDHAVQEAARAARARPLSAEAFARLLKGTLEAPHLDQGAEPQADVSPDELDEWLRLFGEQGEK